MEQPSFGQLFFAFFLPCAILLTQTTSPAGDAPLHLPPPSFRASTPSANSTLPHPQATEPKGAPGTTIATAMPDPNTSLRMSVSTSPATAPSTPAQLPPRTFHDPTYKLSFDYPGDWNFTNKDGEISTFHLDARSAPHNSTLRAVTAFSENPFPASTFSGGYVYFSVTPHTSAAACNAQATYPAGSGKAAPSQVAGIPFIHGHDEQDHICTTDRDEIYTTYHKGSCYRFDLTINNFCGGQVSGVKDISADELDQVRSRLESILSTVRFDPK
jgi:hypothetical protein